MKKTLGMLLVFLLLFSATAAFGGAADDYRYDYGWLFLTGYTGPGGDITLPAEMVNPGNPEKTWHALAIAEGAFSQNDQITGVTMPDSYQAIHPEAFIGCTNLSQVSLPSGLAVIDDRAFAGCTALTEITLPASLSFIGNSAFFEAHSLSAVYFEGPVPQMEKDAFGENADSLIFHVPDDQFEDYAAQLSYAMGRDMTPAMSKSGQAAVMFDHTALLGQALTVGTPDAATQDMFDFDAATGTIEAYRGFRARVDIPDSIGGVPVTSIGYKAFNGNGYVYFVNIPQGVTLIDKSAFDSLPRLSAVQLPSTLKEISENAFYGFAGERLVLNEGLESIGRRAFGFTAGRLKDITFPASLRSIGEDAFYSCGVTNLDLNEGLLSIGDKAFAASNLQGSLILPEGLETIGSEAFARTDIEKVTLPSTMKMVGDRAFSFCMKLETLSLSGYTVPQFGEDVFEKVGLFHGTGYGEQLGAKVTLPADSTQQQVADTQAAFDGLGLKVTAQLAAPEGVQAMTAGTYNVKFKDNMRLLADYTGNLSQVLAPEKYGDFYLEGVFDEAFKGNQALTAFAIPNNGKYVSIGENAFAGSSLSTITLSDSVSNIGAGALRDTKLTDLDLSYVTHIGAAAFQNTPLENVIMNENTVSIGENAFEGTNLTSFVIPSGIEVNPAVLRGIPIDVIRISDQATDEQKAAWNEALNFPWFNPLLRAGEESAYRVMPNTPNDENSFTIDPETGMLLSYTGDAVDVVIPRSIDGVTVTGISYRAFEIARDYTNTDVLTDENQTWLPLRSIVIPETVTLIEDSAFSLCQQLQTVICYGPLENTGRATFQFCRALEDVIFVNGVKLFDNYLFSDCESLQNVYYPGTLDLIGVGAFEYSGIERFTADTKVIGDAAFLSCNRLTDLHIRDSIQKIALNSLSGCASLETICLESKNVTILNDENGYSGSLGGSTRLILPKDTSDEDALKFYQLLSAVNLGPIADPANVLREDCAEPDKQTLPDTAALLAALGAAAPAIEPAPALQPVDAASDASESSTYLGDWYLTSAILDDVSYQAADLGIAVSFSFHPDGTALGNFDGDEESLTWSVQNSSLIVSDGETDNVFTLLDDGTLWVLDDGAQMIFTREAGQTSPLLTPAPAENAVADDFMGVWILSQFSDGNIMMPTAGLQMDTTLTIGATSGEIDIMGDNAPFTYRLEGANLITDELLDMQFTLHEDGRLSTTEDGRSMWFDRSDEVPQALLAPQSPDLPLTQSAPAAADAAIIGNTWVCMAAEASGYPMDIAMLGRYDAIFNADHTAKMSFAGVAIEGATWTDDGKQITVDYYGTPYVFVREGESLQLNYFDAMLLTYERE